MVTMQAPPERLLTPAQVAALVFVDPKTVSRWATKGKIASIRTPGGHRRFRGADVQALVDVSRSRAVGRTAADGSADAAAINLEARAHTAAEAVLEAAASVAVAAERVASETSRLTATVRAATTTESAETGIAVARVTQAVTDADALVAVMVGAFDRSVPPSRTV